MKSSSITRREAITALALGTAAVSAPFSACSHLSPSAGNGPHNPAFRYCLNTSTISGRGSGLLQYIKIAATAGYDGIEVWIRDVEAYRAEGNTMASLKSYIDGYGIRVENAIGFAPWLAEGDSGFRQMEEEMNLLAEIGCSRIAAPPAGLTGERPLDLFEAGEKYGRLLELGRKTGVMPQLEFWGSSPVLWHLGQALMVAAAASDADVRILPDIFHLFRGGSGFESLKMLNGTLIDIFHINDYPGSKPREELTDADRVYPGDGSAPVVQILTDLAGMGGEKVLSLELFNHSYWEEDPLLVARTGLEKMRSSVSALRGT